MKPFSYTRPRRRLEHRDGAGEGGDTEIGGGLEQRPRRSLRVGGDDLEQVALGGPGPCAARVAVTARHRRVAGGEHHGGQVDGGGDQESRLRPAIAEPVDHAVADPADAVDEAESIGDARRSRLVSSPVTVNSTSMSTDVAGSEDGGTVEPATLRPPR